MLALFLLAIVPVIADQVTAIGTAGPTGSTSCRSNNDIKRPRRTSTTSREGEALRPGRAPGRRSSSAASSASAWPSWACCLNVFVVLVLTLYFLASLPTIKKAGYPLAPATRRARVTELGDRILRSIGGYVSGAFVVALCAGLSTLVFLFIVGLGNYALALAMVVAMLDVIPMIGATIGAVIVCAIAFATDVNTGIVAVIFYIAYQQLENYVIYPRVMSHSVEIPGALTVIAALIGGTLLGVVGALLAIPTAASILLLVREVVVRRQDAR